MLRRVDLPTEPLEFAYCGAPDGCGGAFPEGAALAMSDRMVGGRASAPRLPLLRAPGCIVASGFATDRGDCDTGPAPIWYQWSPPPRVEYNALKITKCVNAFILVEAPTVTVFQSHSA